MQIGVNEIAQASKVNHAQCGDRTHSVFQSGPVRPKYDKQYFNV